MIETVFGCPVFDGRLQDGGANALQCEAHEGYHICSEQCYLETIDLREDLIPAKMVKLSLQTSIIMPCRSFDTGPVISVH